VSTIDYLVEACAGYCFAGVSGLKAPTFMITGVVISKGPSFNRSAAVII